MLAELFWIALAIYGVIVQSFNLRWAFYKSSVVKTRINSTQDDLLVVRGYLRLNAVRMSVLIVNLVIGLAALTQVSSQPAHFTPVGAVISLGLLANEIAWDFVTTLELVQRRHLLRQTAKGG